MRVIIAIECRGDRPEPELSHILNEIVAGVARECLTAGEYLLRGTNGHVAGKMFIEDTEGFLTDESYKALAGTIKEQRRQYASELPI